MKHLLTLALLLCLGTFASAQIPSYVPTNGLVGWWPFNGNANDESGNGNHGTVNGATLAADRFGNASKAYSFDGVSDYIECTDIGISGSLSRSVSFWAKTTSINAMGLVNWGGNNSFPNNGKRFSCYFNYVTQGITIDGGDCALTYNANTSNSNNQWSLYTFVMNTSSAINQVQVYQNGILLSVITHSYYPTTILNTLAGTLLQFGRVNYPPGNFDYYQGHLDDIGIWNRALSPAEVQQLYLGNSSNTAAASTVPGKIHYQGLAVGANGKPIKNGTVGLRLSVLDSLPNGSNLYTETQSASTDAAGIFSTYLGGGTATAGTFANIPWANGNDKFLKVEMDAQGGTNYQNMGSTQLVSVPYALHAGSAQRATELMDSAGNAYQIKIVNGQPTLVSAPGNVSIPATFACGQFVNYAGESYPTVQIGSQCWFAKNLNVGTMVLGANDQTNNGTLEKYCYNNDSANCAIYGGLYQWAEAVQYQNGASNTTSPSPAFGGNIKGICPTGWHVPSDMDWSTLEITLGGASVAGGAMKATSGYWMTPNSGASNSSFFYANPSGLRTLNGTFDREQINVYFWESYELGNRIYFRDLGYNNSAVNKYSVVLPNQNFKLGFSVRCLKD